MLNSQIIFSQTENDYYEKLRLERKDKKIKLMKSGTSEIDYFDEQGYHIKKEHYYNGNVISYSIIKQLNNGELSVELNLGPEGNFTTIGSQALFYVTYFDPYNLIDKVVIIFDSKSRLIEKRISGTDFEGLDNIKYFYNKDEEKPIKSEYYSDNKLSNKTDYYYNESGLLIKEENLWLNNNEKSITNYIYEFY